MTAAEFSLLAVVFGFVLLVLWVYSPRSPQPAGILRSDSAEEDDDDDDGPESQSRSAERFCRDGRRGEEDCS